MFGNNKPVPFENYYNGSLDIVKIFKTIQGEGPYAGTPAIFIRLGGCNLKCKFCDTEFDNYKNLSINTIINKVKVLAQDKIGLIVITGGEPLRQDIKELCDILIDENFQVQIETNASLYRDINKAVTIIASPKNANGNGYKFINEKMIKRADYFKFIISASNPNYNFVPDQFHKFNNIYIQPMDEYKKDLNSENMKLCIDLSLQYNFKISIQTHKILNIE